MIACGLLKAEPLTDDYESLLAAASAYEGAFAQAFLAAVKKLKADISEGDLMAAIAAHDYQRIDYLIPWLSFTKHLNEAVEPAYMKTMTAGAVASGHLLEVPKPVMVTTSAVESAGVSARFNMSNPRAVGWARDQAGKLVTEVTDGTRAAIQDIITRSLTGQMTTRQAAVEISRFIGLTQRMQGAVDRYLDNQAKILADLHPKWSQEKVTDTAERRAQRYYDKLVRQRATMIARTETMRASNQGRLELWRQQIDAGLNAGRMEVRWVVTPDDRLCPRCRTMDGKIIGWDEKFSAPSREPRIRANETWDDVSMVMLEAPPLHVNCRCVISSRWRMR